MRALQIKIQLKDFKPSIARTILLSEKNTFYDLHVFIQDLFCLFDYHLWDFSHGDHHQGLRITLPDPEDTEEPWYPTNLDATKTKLSEIFIDRGLAKIRYSYDYGDGWEFEVACQKITKATPGQKFPTLLKAKGPMLIEDCGGPYGLREIFDAYNQGKTYLDWFEDWEDFQEYVEPALEEVDWDDFVFTDPQEAMKERLA